MSNIRDKIRASRVKVKNDGPLVSGFGNSAAVFNKQQDEDQLHPQILKMARKSGQLNLANRGMSKIPIKVYNLNSLDEEEHNQFSTSSLSMDNTDDKWWEQSDLTRLYLNSNSISVVDPLISNLGALQLLDLSDNRLASLPSTIGDLKYLTKLNLGHNDLSQLPEGLCKLDDLRHLSMSHNNLTSLPDDLGSLCVLEHLDVSHNKLNSLPPSIGYLQRIRKLVLSDNQLEKLPLEFGDLFALTHLDLTRNKLKELPSCLKNLQKLEQLYLRQNFLTALPKLQCSSLKELYLGTNRIKSLNVDGLETLTSLHVLDVSSNGLEVIPDEITLLQHLQRLDLTSNYISNLPGHLGFLPHLKSMPLDENPLRMIRRDIVQRGTGPLLSFIASRITQPVKSFPGFENYIPEEIESTDKAIPDQYEMRNMRTMVYNEKTSKIPDALFENGRLAQVRTADLSHNCLTELPEKISELRSHLCDLILHHNKLTILDDRLADFKYLQFIDVQNNRLYSLPQELASLTELREINFSFNKFEVFPEVLYSISSLEIVFAGDNKITSIEAESFLAMKRLATLDLHNNDIKYVPPLLGKMTQLKTLLLQGNGFRVPRFDILAKGTSFLLEYLRSRIVES